MGRENAWGQGYCRRLCPSAHDDCRAPPEGDDPYGRYMEDDPIDHSNDMVPPAQATEDPGTCPLCGSPIDEQAEGVVQRSPAAKRRPTESECWKEFWTRWAYIWINMPPALQQECLADVARRGPISHRPSRDRGPDKQHP